jgi:hypothetical protein
MPQCELHSTQYGRLYSDIKCHEELVLLLPFMPQAQYEDLYCQLNESRSYLNLANSTDTPPPKKKCNDGIFYIL